MSPLSAILLVVNILTAALCWRLWVVLREEERLRVEAEIQLQFGRTDDETERDGREAGKPPV